MPKPFTKLNAIAAPIMRTNIDTDVIIRIERLVGNSVRGTLGRWAFGSLRYLPDGSENPEFILNREPYRQAEILPVEHVEKKCGKPIARRPQAQFGDERGLEDSSPQGAEEARHTLEKTH